MEVGECRDFDIRVIATVNLPAEKTGMIVVVNLLVGLRNLA